MLTVLAEKKQIRLAEKIVGSTWRGPDHLPAVDLCTP
jgi:hypothetical protein